MELGYGQLAVVFDKVVLVDEIGPCPAYQLVVIEDRGSEREGKDAEHDIGNLVEGSGHFFLFEIGGVIHWCVFDKAVLMVQCGE